LRVRIAELCAEESALREILVAGTTGDAADTAERIGVRAEFERIGALINEFRAALDELPTSHRGTAGVGSVVIALCGWRGGDVHPRVGARGKRRIARVESAVAARACADRRGRRRERGVRLASWSQRCHCDGVALMRETGSRSWLVALYDRTGVFVYRLALCPTRDAAAATTVTEAVFTQVARTPGLLPTADPPFAVLLRMTRDAVSARGIVGP